MFLTSSTQAFGIYAGNQMLDQLCAADFDTLPQRSLGVTFAGTARVLQIVEIQFLSAVSTSSARAAPPFAMLLRDNGARASMPQGTYVYQHPVHGELVLFTVPLGPDSHGMLYEVAFN
jgi:hypothetical protein